jgi:LDH2 family malate/lactate/ureidoglycolate dehydrogenase
LLDKGGRFGSLEAERSFAASGDAMLQPAAEAGKTERVSVDLWHAQLLAILRGLGLAGEDAAATATILTEADLAGIDSHGAGLLDLYERQIREGGAVGNPEIRVIRDHAALALLDAGGGFGHRATLRAVEMAVERARRFGIAAIGIRNSNHFGAAGPYVRRLAEAGLIGFCFSSVWRPAIVPSGGREPRLGTNPIAFAAPSAAGRPFLLDMATSAAAIGKLRLARDAGKTLPEGWALDHDGRPEHDPAAALEDARLVPLGGYKGYGLAGMVEVLASVLTGAAVTPARTRQGPAGRWNVGHLVMALDPALMRGEGFGDDLDRMTAALRATPPADLAQPVLVAGDPERACAAEREKSGIPATPEMLARLRAMADRAGAPFLIGGATGGND